MGAAVAAALVLVVLTAVRDGRPWAAVLVHGAVGIVGQLALLDGLGLALTGEVIELLLGAFALRSPVGHR